MANAPVFLPLSQLIVPAGRQRQEFDPTALLELASSIRQRGLLHALVVREDGRTLVTGERRMRAVLEHLVPFGQAVRYAGEALPLGCLPVIKAGTGDPLELEEIELDENLRRKDLTWKELATTTARLHTLRTAQVEAKQAAQASAGSNVVAGLLSALPPAIPSHTVADTAKEVRGSAVGWNHDATRQEILIARHLDRPEIAAAPTLKDAFKVLKRLDETERNTNLARLVGDTYTTAQHQVIHANCLSWMADLEREAIFDVILTDPPYGMGAQDFGDAGGKMATIEHHYDDSYESWLLLLGGRKLLPDGSKIKVQKSWCELAFAVTKAEAHAYIFCDIDRFHELKFFMESAGWYVFRTPLTNYKRNSGRVPLPDQGPRRQTEWCLYAIKGKKKVTGIYSDLIATDSDEQLGHGAQKPVALYEDLLKRSVRPGDRLLDTFGGTGTLLPAAHIYKCYAVVVEQNEASYGKCLERLATLGKQVELLP